MKDFKKWFVFGFCLLFTSPVTILNAGPTVIQDDRVTNLATTPVLGRGYSISTNTFQSTCLKDIVITQPSYDFSYLFQEMDAFIEESSKETDTLTKLVPKSFKRYVVKRKHDNEVRRNFWAERRKNTRTTVVNEELETQKKTGTIETERTMVAETKTIIATINLHSYYASVDESASKVSDSAATLLNNSDIPGFFASCGSYYIRSIGRRAQFIAVFEFESVSLEEDQKFTYQLETELKSFRKTYTATQTVDRRRYWGGQTQARTSYGYEVEESTETKVVAEELEDTFSKNASSRNLTITATAFGLGKNENASLISYDIKTFKAAIKDAFQSMQNPETGKVDSIEVVPWVENTEFQTLVGLEEDVEVEEEVTVGNTKVQETRKVLLYEKKFLLNINAEFLAELQRADRAMMNLYYKAKLCRRNIDSQWKVKDKDGNMQIKADYQERFLMNNRYKDSGIKLVDFDRYLTKERIEGMLQNHRTYIYGGGDWGDGARSCMRKLMAPKAIFSKNYRDFVECERLEQNLGNIEEQIVENYCMPRLFDKWQTPKEVSSVTQEL